MAYEAKSILFRCSSPPSLGHSRSHWCLLPAPTWGKTTSDHVQGVGSAPLGGITPMRCGCKGGIRVPGVPRSLLPPGSQQLECPGRESLPIHFHRDSFHPFSSSVAEANVCVHRRKAEPGLGELGRGGGWGAPSSPHSPIHPRCPSSHHLQLQEGLGPIIPGARCQRC